MIAATDCCLLVHEQDTGLKKYAKLTVGSVAYPLIQLAALVEKVASMLITAAITYLFLILPDQMHIVDSLEKWTADAQMSLSISGCRGINNFQRVGKSDMDNLISSALYLLAGKVDDIQAELVDDEDQNHKLTLVIGSIAEKASLFALRENGFLKSEKDMVRELVKKVENHMKNRENPKNFFLPSGAMIYSELEDIEFGVDRRGCFTINGKMALLGDKALEAEKIHSYTIFTASREGDLLILSDKHDKVRTDGKEGLVFNLDENPFLQCYRTRAAACQRD